MSVQEIERPPRGNESRRAKHYDYKVRWRYAGRQPSVIVGNKADAEWLNERMKFAAVPTAAEARALLAERIGDPGGRFPIGAARVQGIEVSRAPTLREVFSEHVNRPGLAKGSTSAYQGAMNRCGPLLDLRVDEIKRSHVSALFRSFQEPGDTYCAPTTRRNTRDALLSAMRRGGIDTTPFLTDLRNVTSDRLVVPVYLTDEQVMELLEAAKADHMPLYAPIRTAIDTAPRIGELLGLTSAWVNLDDREVRFENQLKPGAAYTSGLELVPLKTKRSHRRVPISDALVKVLEDYVDYRHPDLPLFHPPSRTWWTRPTFGYNWKRLLKACPSIPEHMRFHDVRHTAVMRWRANNVDLGMASQMLGHSDTKITLETYGEWNTHADDVMRKAQLPY